MNTTDNEPKVELPEPPEGHRWEYRGLGWNREKPTTYCHTTLYCGLTMRQSQTPQGVGDYHYWEAVPDTPFTSTGAKIEADYIAILERENAELRQVIETTRTQFQSALDDLVRANDSRLPTSEKSAK